MAPKKLRQLCQFLPWVNFVRWDLWTLTKISNSNIGKKKRNVWQLFCWYEKIGVQMARIAIICATHCKHMRVMCMILFFIWIIFLLQMKVSYVIWKSSSFARLVGNTTISMKTTAKNQVILTRPLFHHDKVGKGCEVLIRIWHLKSFKVALA